MSGHGGERSRSRPKSRSISPHPPAPWSPRRSKSPSFSPVLRTPSATTATPRPKSSTKNATGKKRIRPSEESPREFLDNESLSCLASPFGPIRTPAVSTAEKGILVERLRKEIVTRFGFTLSASRRGNKRRRRGGGVDRDEGGGEDRSPGPAAARPSIAAIKSRLVVGTNQVTRALEGAVRGAGPAPTLVLLARDVRPPTILAHVPSLCRAAAAPLLLLPGKASTELGKALGGKTVAVLAFLPLPAGVSADKGGGGGADEKESTEKCHRGIDSFVAFAQGKVP